MSRRSECHFKSLVTADELRSVWQNRTDNFTILIRNVRKLAFWHIGTGFGFGFDFGFGFGFGIGFGFGFSFEMASLWS